VADDNFNLLFEMDALDEGLARSEELRASPSSTTPGP